MVHSHASHQSSKLCFAEISIAESLHQVELLSWKKTIEQFHSCLVDVAHSHYFQRQFDTIASKNLVATDADTPAYEDGNLLHSLVLTVEVQIRIVTDTTNTQFKFLTVDALKDSRDRESKRHPLVELSLFALQKFRSSLTQSIRCTTSYDVRDTDRRIINGFATIEVFGCFMYAVDEILMGNR